MTQTSREYFENFSPTYSIHNVEFIVKYLKKNKKINSVLDIGCGNGESLSILEHELGVDVHGLEEALAYKDKMSKKTQGKIYWVSILDKQKLKKINKKFDVVIISRVLHHLVSNTPKKSHMLSRMALENAMDLLAQDGQLVIFEPAFELRIFNRLLFFVKKFFGKFSKKRITIFGYWNNIGEPVVNYFSEKELKGIVKEGKIVHFESLKTDTPPLVRMFFKGSYALVVVQKIKK